MGRRNFYNHSKLSAKSGKLLWCISSQSSLFIRQGSYLCGRWSLVQTSSLFCIANQLYCQPCCRHVHLRYYPSSWHTNLIVNEQRVSPADGWENQNPQPLFGGLFKVFHWWSSSWLVATASLDRMALQHGVTLIPPNDTIRSSVWLSTFHFH